MTDQHTKAGEREAKYDVTRDADLNCLIQKHLGNAATVYVQHDCRKLIHEVLAISQSAGAEPVAWYCEADDGDWLFNTQNCFPGGHKGQPLYAAPQRQAAGDGLTMEKANEQDLNTSAGARAYVSDYFANKIGRHDFKRYIRESLAADFACALAKYLSAPRQPGEVVAGVRVGILGTSTTAPDTMAASAPEVCSKCWTGKGRVASIIEPALMVDCPNCGHPFGVLPASAPVPDDMGAGAEKFLLGCNDAVGAARCRLAHETDQEQAAKSDDMVLVRREMVAAACHSIDKQRPAPTVLKYLRAVAMDTAASAQQDGPWYEHKANDGTTYWLRTPPSAQQDEREARPVKITDEHFSLLAMLQISSCHCGTKTPDAKYHESACQYRLACEIEDYLKAPQVQADAGAVARLTDGDFHEMWKLYTVSSYRDGKPAPYALLRAVEQETIDRYVAAHLYPAAESDKRDDAALLDWLMHNIGGSALRAIGVITSAGCDRDAIRAAMSREQSGGGE